MDMAYRAANRSINGHATWCKSKVKGHAGSRISSKFTATLAAGAKASHCGIYTLVVFIGWMEIDDVSIGNAPLPAPYILEILRLRDVMPHADCRAASSEVTATAIGVSSLKER